VKVGITAIFDVAADRRADAVLEESGLRQTAPEEAVGHQVQALRSHGAEVVILLAHTGMARAKEIVRQTEGVHLAVVGGSGLSTSVPLRAGEVYLVEAGRRGRNLGHAQLRLGEGWEAGAQLDDDSTRQNLYEEARAELARLRSGKGRKRRSRRHGRAAAPAAEGARLRTLVKRLEPLEPPEGPHSIIGLLVELDASHPDDPAVKGLLDDMRKEWRKKATKKRRRAGRRGRPSRVPTGRVTARPR
jgi:hypothetical protein